MDNAKIMCMCTVLLHLPETMVLKHSDCKAEMVDVDGDVEMESGLVQRYESVADFQSHAGKHAHGPKDDSNGNVNFQPVVSLIKTLCYNQGWVNHSPLLLAASHIAIED